MLNVDSTAAVQYQWYIWRLLGLHPPDGDTFWARHYTAYGIIINLFANCLTPLPFYIETMLSSSLTEFCEIFYVAGVVAVEQIKFVNVWRVRFQLKKLHMILNKLDARLQNESEYAIIREHVTNTRRIFVAVSKLFVFILLSALFFVICSSSQELPFPSWYPWNWQGNKRAYNLTVILQFAGLCALALITLNNDTYPMTYLIMVAGHYRALARRVSRLGYRNESRGKVYGQLIDCIEDHKTILILLDTIKDALSSACFFQFAVTASSLCTLTFYVMYVKVSLSKLLNLFLMFLGIIFETLIICYAAEDLGVGSEQLSHAIYASNWQHQSVPYQRILLLMLKRSQRPATIVAAGLMPVSMTSFLAVVKMAYTMFTLLNEINS